jgi:TonB-linked SusC/RagA family outer membrane protein
MNNFRRLIAVLIAAGLAPATLMAQEAATVTGRVTNAQGQPEAAVLVRIESLNVGASTGADGNYRLVIPATRIRAGQSVTVTASRTGLSPVSRSITLSPGATLQQNFQLATSVLLLEDVVVTGTAGAVESRKVPFEVGQVTAEDIQVPPRSAAGAIQGKVAGATVVQGSGRPGSAPSILLRGPKSINAAGRSQEPLYIVDGVILGASMADIDALDIEKIEVLKGAAAASLYGSRAANGVVQITTRRGNRVADDQVRYAVRSEYGRSNLPATPDALLARTHQYRDTVINGEQFFFTTGGTRCRFTQCTSLAPAGQRRGTGTAGPNNTYLEKPYLGASYDQIDRFFEDGISTTNYFSAEGRAGATNFHVSFNNARDEGIVPGLEGLNRNNFRVNVDQAIRSNVSVSASAFYSRSTNDQLPEGGGNPLFDLTRTPAGVNIWACEGDTLGTSDCRNRPDSLRLQINPINTESENPAYSLLNREYKTERGRFLGSANFRYSPVSWFDVDANASYDRLDRRDTDLYPDGFRTLTTSAVLNNGRLFRYNLGSEAFNGSMTGTFRFDLTDNIHNRTQFRYLYEETDLDETSTSGYEFVVGDVESFANVNSENLSAASNFEPVRADGYFAITNFDIADRYVIDALIRNDGSSLFGREERRQWYYRLAGAWLLSEESWFNLPAVDDLKLRYSVGTAGGRPAFAAQYETFTITSGSVSPLTLGNNDLKPEFTTEHEAGFDLGLLNNRATLTMNYARSSTADQILPLPLPAYTGYSTRTINAGTLESNTWELSLDTRLVDRGDFGWNARVNFDRTRSEITQMNVPGYRYGASTSQGLANVFYAREGEELGTFYGLQFARSCEDLPAAVANLPGGVGGCDKFRVNDEGMLVWTGGQELTAAAWGTTAPLALQTAHPRLGGLAFGLPFGGLCNDRVSGQQTDFCPLGRTLPDYTLSFSSTMSYGGLSVYGLLDAVQGFDVYNQPLQWATFASISGIMDQTGVEESLKKPLAYYNQLYGASGLRPSSYFVEDGSFVKFRELSVRYTFGERLLGRLPAISNFDGLSLFVTGRNLKTWTDYRGYDPEVGASGAQTGSAALGRVEGYQYPNFRTWTLGAEVNF